MRDVAELRAMGFPAWSAAISAQGTVKETPGAVNVPVSVGGQIVRPGDVIIADDDGVVCVPRGEVEPALAAAQARVAKEEQTRRALADGQLGLDLYGLRAKLAARGVEWVSAAEEGRPNEPGDGVRCMLMRGGTSKGAYFLAEDLPAGPGRA